MSLNENIRLGTGQLLQRGEYGKDVDGKWYAVCPNGAFAGLANHEVTEHEDGTITVAPSILVRGTNGGVDLYHGFLTRGVWTSA